jgi:hypothetical protein
MLTDIILQLVQYEYASLLLPLPVLHLRNLEAVFSWNHLILSTRIHRKGGPNPTILFASQTLSASLAPFEFINVSLAMLCIEIIILVPALSTART